MQAIIDACTDTEYPACVKVVITDKPDATGIQIAREYNIPTLIIEPRNYANKTAFEEAVHDKLIEHSIDFVCLAGFMRILTSGFITQWERKLVNIHPSLLPAFKGLNTHKRALDAGVKWHGCSVHYVDTVVDSGKIIDQTVVPVFNDDTENTLAKRVLDAEHILYQRCIRMLSTNK